MKGINPNRGNWPVITTVKSKELLLFVLASLVVVEYVHEAIERLVQLLMLTGKQLQLLPELLVLGLQTRHNLRRDNLYNDP